PGKHHYAGHSTPPTVACVTVRKQRSVALLVTCSSTSSPDSSVVATRPRSTDSTAPPACEWGGVPRKSWSKSPGAQPAHQGRPGPEGAGSRGRLHARQSPTTPQVAISHRRQFEEKILCPSALLTRGCATRSCRP